MYKAEIDQFKQKRVLIIGDVMLDKYTYGTVSRTSPEAPIPIVKVTEESFIPGGAANVAANIAALKANAILAGVIGDDEDGQLLLDSLKAMNIDTRGILIQSGSKTIRKNRVIAQNQQLLRLDYEDEQLAYDEAALYEQLKPLIEEADVVVLSDYRKGTIDQALCELLSQTSHQRQILIDPKPDNVGHYPKGALLTPNRKEAFEMAGSLGENDVEVVAKQLVVQLDSDVLMTLSEDGMLYTPRTGNQTRVPTRAREVYDVTGAGDTVIATLALALATDMDMPDAINLANHAAGISVASVGCATVTPRQLILAFNQDDSKIKTREALIAEIEELKSRGRTIATLNGCFDILHPGHIHIISEAKKQADILVVALNADVTIRKSKGPDRPINNQDMRATVMAALGYVDFVTIFDEDTPMELIYAIKPNVHVNDASYGTDCIESPAINAVGARLHLVQKLETPSTTDKVKVIRNTT